MTTACSAPATSSHTTTTSTTACSATSSACTITGNHQSSRALSSPPRKRRFPSLRETSIHIAPGWPGCRKPTARRLFFLARHYFLLIFATGRQPLPYTRNCIKYNAIHHTTRSVSARQYGTNAKKSTLDHCTATDTPGHRRDVGRTMLMHRTSVCRVPVGRRLLSHRQQLHDDSHNATVRLCTHCHNNPRPTPAAISGHDPPPCGQANATPPVAHTAGGPRPRAPRPLGRNDCHTEGLTLSTKRH